MTTTREELRYAAEVVIPVVQDVYERYDSGIVQTVAPNVQHLADIRANTRRVEEAKLETDPASAEIIQAVFEQAAHDPQLFGAIDYDPTTSTAFIAFRGTRKGTEWIDDLKPYIKTFKDVGNPTTNVHGGFLEVWSLARQSVYDQLHLLPQVNRLIITGHSLGAAVASLCALDLATQGGYTDLRCWTLASPRTFFGRPKRFDTSITQSIRVHNPADIVTHVPPPLFIHVAGGLSIQAKLADFHSLMLTYQPELDRIANSVRTAGIQLEESEDVVFDSIDRVEERFVDAQEPLLNTSK